LGGPRCTLNIVIYNIRNDDPRVEMLLPQILLLG
jgi:hypothetical protein